MAERLQAVEGERAPKRLAAASRTHLRIFMSKTKPVSRLSTTKAVYQDGAAWVLSVVVGAIRGVVLRLIIVAGKEGGGAASCSLEEATNAVVVVVGGDGGTGTR